MIIYYMDFPLLCGGVVSVNHKEMGVLVHSLFSAVLDLLFAVNTHP